MKTDLRSIATAVEAYAADLGDDPRNGIGGHPSAPNVHLAPLGCLNAAFETNVTQMH